VQRGSMVRKRPCRVCRRWFLPHPRAGDRQKVCSSAECQRERHRRSCARWHEKTPDYDREHRLRKGLQATDATGTEVDPLRRLDWEAARDAVGLQVAVTLEEVGGVLVDWARDAVLTQQREIPWEFGGEVRAPARDAFDRARAPP
jgi:hypothetical protein